MFSAMSWSTRIRQTNGSSNFTPTFLKSRVRLIDLLRGLPQLALSTDDEVLYFIERHKLMGRGMGYVDAHLLAAVTIGGAQLWTRDKRLGEIATELGVAHLEADQ